MKGKRKRKLRYYVTCLLAVGIFVSVFADDWGNFFLGLFAGFHGIGVQQAKEQFGELSRIISWSTMVLVVIVILLVFRKMRRKVTKPIEQLADGMKEVSQGLNLCLLSPYPSVCSFPLSRVCDPHLGE